MDLSWNVLDANLRAWKGLYSEDDFVTRVNKDRNKNKMKEVTFLSAKHVSSKHLPSRNWLMTNRNVPMKETLLI